MVEWIRDYRDVLSVLLNLGMLLVWLVYLQIFIAGFLRKRRPKLLIAEGAGSDLNARCLISNMSEDAMYIANIIASVRGPKDSRSSSVIDIRAVPDETSRRDPKQKTNQGPLEAGGYMDAGSFQDFVDRALTRGEDISSLMQRGVCVLEVTVVAIYASEELPAAAMRHFSLVPSKGRVHLRPQSFDTRQIRSRRERKRLRRELERDIQGPEPQPMRGTRRRAA